jgi:SAM-dependent methyltransferase
MPDYERIYRRQEYLTPGARETAAILVERAVALGAKVVVDVASGKGEAACAVAQAAGCRVVMVDAFLPFMRHAASKVRARGLGGRVHAVYAEGGRIPAPDNAFDAGYCIGAPSLVGLQRCARSLARVVRPGGAVVVSDITWRRKPGLGPEWLWIAEFQQLTREEYARELEAPGMSVDRVFPHPRSAWDDYFAPMRAVAQEARAAGDAAFADECERGIEIESRAADEFLDYTTFACSVR